MNVLFLSLVIVTLSLFLENDKCKPFLVCACVKKKKKRGVKIQTLDTTML